MKSSYHVRNVIEILHGKPAADLADLPIVWKNVTQLDYIEAARLFHYHNTPLGLEALQAIGQDFQKSAYPDFDAFCVSSQNDILNRTCACASRFVCGIRLSCSGGVL